VGLFAEYWNYYRGKHRRPLVVRPGQANDNTIVNYSRRVVDKSVAFLFGESPTFEVDDQRAEDCDVFFAFRPDVVRATGGWRLESNHWLLTLPWETLYDTGCADWPSPSENLPPVEYCHTECASVSLYSSTPTCT
jgi:hypothetical protein